jgi:amino acid adenylation domain-containing protein
LRQRNLGDVHSEGILEWLAEACSQSRERVAIEWRDQRISYGELNDRANQVANCLITNHLSNGAIVAATVEDRVQMITTLLGIFRAGGVFVPLDMSSPKERLLHLVEELAPDAFIIEAKHGRKLISIGEVLRKTCKVITTRSDDEANAFAGNLTAIKERLEAYGTQTPSSPVDPDAMRYIYYTSGSTGRPKGIAGKLRSLSHFIQWEVDAFQIDAGWRVSQFTVPTFDAYFRDVLVPLCAGGTVCIPPDKPGDLDINELVDWIDVNGINLIHCVPSLFAAILEGDLNSQRFQSLKYILQAGEVLHVSRVKQWRDIFQDRIKLVNLYGPTETTMVKLFHIVEESDLARGVIPVGKPMRGAEAIVLDEQGTVCPPDVAGEIYIRTPYLTLGYYKDPEATKTVFVRDPFSNEPSDILYKTGDLGLMMEDGNVRFLGRKDNQAKIRGIRVEPEEVENHLQTHPHVQKAAVVAREDVPGNTRLVAYFIPSQELTPTAEELRDFLRQKLPEPIVPSAFVKLANLPLMFNGKLDRKALPPPEFERPDLANTFVRPRSQTEQLLAEIWCHVFGLKQVGVYDDFFDLGGHSLLVTQVISRIRKVFHVTLPLRCLFESPTIASLATQIETARQDKPESPEPVIHPIPRQGSLVLSFGQQQLWLHDQYATDTPNNISRCIRLSGHLHVEVLHNALNTIVARHEVLRTTFAAAGGDPVQVIHPSASVALPVIDLSTVPTSQREGEVRRLFDEDAQRLFNLSTDLMLRVTLLQLSATEHALILTTHHIAADDWSIGVLLREISSLYEAFVSGKPSPLPELPIQYADFACWQRQWLQDVVLESHASYWKKTLAGSPLVLALPTDRPRPSIPTLRGAEYSSVLPGTLTAALKSLTRREGATLFMTLLAAFKTLLYRYTRQEDVNVGTVIANRNRVEIEGLIGFFVNTLVLRTDLSGDPTFRELVGRVGEVAMGAYAHQDMPFDKVLEIVNPKRDVSSTPLFQVAFMVHNAPKEQLEIPNLTCTFERKTITTSLFDLTLEIAASGDGLITSFMYRTDLFEPSTIRRLAGHYRELLEGVAADPQQRISRLPLSTQAERPQLLSQWSTVRTAPRSGRCIHHLFEAQVDRAPQAAAVEHEGQRLTYQQLNARANQLAHYLHKHGVGPEVRVGLCVERSLEMVVGLLGVLKAGGAYVPLDPLYPQSRLQLMSDDAQVRVLLTQQRLRQRLPASKAEVVCLDADWSQITRGRSENFDSGVQSQNLAYVIYTSGSTGRPKGVMIEHGSLVNYVEAAIEAYGIESTDRVLQFASISFDASAEEIYPCLARGGTLVLRTAQMIGATAKFLEHCREWSLTVTSLPTAYWHEVVMRLAAEALTIPPSVRLVIIGGEAARPEIVALWQRQVGERVRLLNTYGPTEATVVVTQCDLSRLAGVGARKEVPIGRALRNVQTYILDSQLQPVPVGVPGELFLGGDSLARGYLNRPELTAEKFVPNPFDSEAGARLYGTGDLARWLADGTIEFLGRVDHQVKIRGCRVELGEIEAVLRQHASVGECLVAEREDGPGDKRLVAYLVARNGSPPTTPELRNYLKEQLPEYMVPSAFVILDALPLAPNGKVDRQALPVLNPTRSEPDDSFVTPRNNLERQLTNIWQELLGVPRIGVKDNFFDLGGHSLLAVRLIARIEKRFGKALPLATIFQAPTIERLASTLRRQESSPPWSRLVPFQTGGSKPPFFCLNATGQALAKLLGPDQPLYGLQAHGLDGRRAPSTVQNMAADYIKEIRTIQPHGPYYIGGYSFGGMVAFELAQQLQQQGEEVALLVLLDPTKPNYREVPSLIIPRSAGSSPSSALLLDEICEHLQNLVMLPFQKKVAYLLVRVTWRIAMIKPALVITALKMVANRFCFAIGCRVPVTLRKFYFVKISGQAARGYAPQVYTGDMVLLRTQTPSDDSQLDWPKLTGGGLEIRELPVGHSDILKEPYVQVLAKHLEECLHGAQSTRLHRLTARGGTRGSHHAIAPAG